MANTDVTGPTDLKGKVVGGQVGADGEDIIRQIGGFKEIRVYPGLSEMMNDFLAGRLDVVIAGDIQAGAFLKARPGSGKIVGKPYKTNYVGIPMTLGSTALKSDIDAAITAARADGTLDKLADQYFGLAHFTDTLPPAGSPPPSTERRRAAAKP